MINLYKPARLVYKEEPSCIPTDVGCEISRLAEEEQVLATKLEMVRLRKASLQDGLDELRFEANVTAQLSRVNDAAKHYLMLAQEEKKYFPYGNLGDNWLPALDGLIGLYEARFHPSVSSPNKALAKKAITDISPLLKTLESYLIDAQMYTQMANPDGTISIDENSWSVLKDFRNRVAEFEKL